MSEGQRCPYCTEDRMIEFDPVLKRWVCFCCGKSWPKA